MSLFLWLPDNSLWDYSYFSSDTSGFWIFTTIFVVLFSAKWHIAAINAELYVLFLVCVANPVFFICNFSLKPIDTDSICEYNVLVR